MNKAYSRINWENYPSDSTPLNETNLNKIDVAADEIDNRVILLNTTKFDKSEAQGLFKDVSLDRSSGVITFTLYNGATKTLDTLLERIAINFDYDAATQRLVITLDDGAVKYVDMSALITQYEFLDTDTVAFSIDSTGKVSAIVKEGSIQEKHLRPNYLADIKVESAKAATSAATAESYAKGGTGTRDGENTDNAKYYMEQTKNISEDIEGKLDTAYTHSQSEHAPSNAEENQNAFSNVVVGSTTISADSKTDTLTLSGSNVTLTPDTANDKVTIGITQSNVINALGFLPGTSGVTLGNTGNSVTYTAFARTSSTGTLGECTGTFILTDCGNYGGALAGVWLIQISNKNSIPMMSVTTLNPHKAGTVEFGCYKSGEYFYFGVCCPTYRATVRLITLNKVRVETADYGDSRTKPSGWTVVTPRVLQDNNAFDSIQTQLEDLTANIQQNDVIANISSSSSSNVSEDITILSKDYRAFIIVLCNGDEFDHTVINTYTWLSSMVNGYYRLELYDPSNNVYIGYIEFVWNSIYVYLNKYDEYYVDIYGLISL